MDKQQKLFYLEALFQKWKKGRQLKCLICLNLSSHESAHSAKNSLEKDEGLDYGVCVLSILEITVMPHI